RRPPVQSLAMETPRLLSIPCLFLLAVPLHAQSGRSLERKQVAAPASDILSGMVRLPDRWDHPETIRGSLLEFQGKEGLASFWAPAGDVRVIPIWEDQAAKTWDFRIGSGEWLGWDRLETLGLGQREEVAPTDHWTAMSPQQLTIHLPAPAQISIRGPKGQHVLIGDSTSATLEHGLDSYRLQQGQSISNLARLECTAGAHTILKAELELSNTRGTQTLAMHDDGQHGDGKAHDGLWGVRIPQHWIGDIAATTRVVAKDESGQRFSRNGVQRFRIESESVVFTGQVQVQDLGRGAWNIRLPASVSTPLPFLHFAAEVWGTNSKGQAIPICWLARQCEVDPTQPNTELSLELDPRWLRDAQRDAPFELRNVRVQDPNTWTVLAEQAHFGLDLPALGSPTPRMDSQADLTFRAAMPPPSGSTQVGSASTQATSPAFGLMLVHGWCSGGGVWPTSQFNHPLLVHHDPDANRSHDEFAQLLANLGSGKRSFGVIGHSQGGPAAMQLRTYYVSGLDRAHGGRPIQSLASPYLGTPLAGLGFFLCGSSTDLGTSGSAAWLANIPASVRDEVYYYTTSNTGSACNFATNIFLSNPEDGTVEQFRGQLVGAHNMGHVTGWCHTTGMTNPAGYNDSSRNAILDQEAAN
ncbi:MAG: hypothetical protein P1V35_13885, partial [Planctomycetota bacterium]|nr:hypothetical protein [Planctomycetota bacterium]